MIRFGKIIGILIIISLIIVNVGTSKQIYSKNEKSIESETFRTRNLANMKLDFSRDIDAISLGYIYLPFRPEGTYKVNVEVNYNCPLTRMIEIRYAIAAAVHTNNPWYPEVITFCYIIDNLTIINGSNPQNISLDFIEMVPSGNYFVYLEIEADIKEYKFIDGKWEKIGQEHKWRGIDLPVNFFDWITPRQINEKTRNVRLFDFYERIIGIYSLEVKTKHLSLFM